MVVWVDSDTGLTSASRYKNEREAEIKLVHMQVTTRGWGWMGHIKMEGSSK